MTNNHVLEALVPVLLSNVEKKFRSVKPLKRITDTDSVLRETSGNYIDLCPGCMSAEGDRAAGVNFAGAAAEGRAGTSDCAD